MPYLAEVPAGSSLFIDTNCLIYHFCATHPTCTLTVSRSERGEIRLFTSVVVVAELRHRLMMMEVNARLHVPLRNVRDYLRRHPDQIRILRKCIEAVETLGALRVEILPIAAEIVLASQQMSEDYGLLTNDALIVATMRAHRLTHLASNDTDFLRVPGLTLWRP